MRQISPYYLFLVVLWWPLPLLPGVTGWDISGPLAITIMTGIWALLAKYIPDSDEPGWRDLAERHKVPWRRLLLAVAGLEAVLLFYLWEFGAGHEQVEPYAGWLAPIAEAVGQTLPKFRLMASNLEEMGLAHRVNLVLVAYGITYAAQPVLAALWIVPVYRLHTEVPPEKFRTLRGWRRFGYFLLLLFCIAAVLAMVILVPETSDVRGRKDFFHQFESRDPHLFYQCIVWVNIYCQGSVLLLVMLFAFMRMRQPQPASGA